MAGINIQVNNTADPHALDIVRGGKSIANIQWHPERPPRLVFNELLGELNLDELDYVLNRYNMVAGSKK